MARIISLNAAKEVKTAALSDWDYQAKIMGMDKLGLLEEMIRFQEERSQLGALTPTLMVRGKILFKALSDSAETDALRSLTRSYLRHLDCEMRSFLQDGIRFGDQD